MNLIFSKDINYYIENNLCSKVGGLIINYIPIGYINLDFIFEFSNISYLKLERTTDITEYNIPDLSQLLFLENLHLLNFCFSKFPVFIKSLKLKILEISFSYMPNIYPEIYELTNLRILKLRYSNICNIGDNIKNLVNLQILDLFDNPIKTISPNIALLRKLESINITCSIVNPKLFFKNYILHDEHLIIFNSVDYTKINTNNIKHITILDSVKFTFIDKIINNLPPFLESITIGPVLTFCPLFFPVTLKNLRIKTLDLSNCSEKYLKIPFGCTVSIGITIK